MVLFGKTRSNDKKKGTSAAGDQESIGSDLSESDQFFIVLRGKEKHKSWASKGDDSTVSSITIADMNPGCTFPRGYEASQMNTVRKTKGWCCYSSVGTEPTAASDNTMYASVTSENREMLKIDDSSAGCFLLECCNRRDPLPSTCVKPKPREYLDRANALFDAMEDEEDDGRRLKRIWRPSIRRAMSSWKRRQPVDAP